MNSFTTAWLRLSRQRLHTTFRTRFFNSTTKRLTQPPTQTTTSTTIPTPTRFDRFIARTPTVFLRTRLQALKSAPLTTVTSFLILHELTAVVPLFGLAGAFHYYNWLPPFFAEGEWVLKGVSLFGNYFRRKGWITASDAQNAKDAAEDGQAEQVERRGTKSGQGSMGKWWSRGEGGTRLVIEFATAYAVVKALMPLRIVVSIWGAPWFARWTVIPMSNLLFRRGRDVKNVVKASASGAKKG